MSPQRLKIRPLNANADADACCGHSLQGRRLERQCGAFEKGSKTMTLTLELKPEEIAALESKAQAEGVDMETALRGLIEQIQPGQAAAPSRHAEKPATGKEPKRLRAFGKYAHLGLSSEEYAREKREELEREQAA